MHLLANKTGLAAWDDKKVGDCTVNWTALLGLVGFAGLLMVSKPRRALAFGWGHLKFLAKQIYILKHLNNTYLDIDTGRLKKTLSTTICGTKGRFFLRHPVYVYQKVLFSSYSFF